MKRTVACLGLMALAGCGTPGQAGLVETAEVSFTRSPVDLAYCIEEKTAKTQYPVDQFRTPGDKIELVGVGGLLGPDEMWRLMLNPDGTGLVRARSDDIRQDIVAKVASCDS